MAQDLHLSLVFWGEWHRAAFLTLNLPSMLSSRNLPALAEHGRRISFEIFTTFDDLDFLQGSPLFARLSEVCDVVLRPFEIPPEGNPMALHHDFWNRSVRTARERGAYVLMIPPDVIWSDGSFTAFAADIDAGKDALFLGMPRVAADSLVAPADGARAVASPNAPRDWSPRDLMALAEQHPHPLFFCYEEGSRHFPIHPELLIWRIEGEGYVVRFLVRELLGFNTRALSFRSAHPVRPLAAERFKLYRDSDEACVLSLAPLLKDVDWYRLPRVMDDLAVGKWWIDNEYAMNDAVSDVPLRFKTGARQTEARWRAVEARSQVVVDRLKRARDLARFATFLAANDATHAASIVSMGISHHHLASVPLTAGGTIVIPSDGCLDEAQRSFVTRVLVEAPAAVFRRFVAGHVCDEKLYPDGSDGVRELRTRAGTLLKVERDRFGGLRIDGALAIQMGTAPTGHEVYRVESPMDPTGLLATAGFHWTPAREDADARH